MTVIAGDVDAALRTAGVPIIGVSLGDRDDRATWIVHFDPSATQDHRTLAAQVIQDFTPPEVVAEITPTDVLAYVSGKLGVSVEDATADIQQVKATPILKTR